MPVHASLAGVATYSPYLGAMLVGFVVGTIGHIMRSTTVILLGILIIGATSVAILIGVSAS